VECVGAQKRVDEKTADDGKRKLVLAFDEIQVTAVHACAACSCVVCSADNMRCVVWSGEQALSGQNSHVPHAKTAMEKTIQQKKTERGTSHAPACTRIGMHPHICTSVCGGGWCAARRLHAKRAGAGAEAAGDKRKHDLADIQMQPVQQLTAKEKEWMCVVDQNVKEQVPRPQRLSIFV
jgi:hypothetical protein